MVEALELAHTVIKEICSAQLDLQQKAGKPKWYDAGVDAELDAKYGGLFDAKISEQGIAGVDVHFWWGFVGPAGLPAEVVTKVNAESNKALALPAVG